MRKTCQWFFSSSWLLFYMNKRANARSKINMPTVILDCCIYFGFNANQNPFFLLNKKTRTEWYPNRLSNIIFLRRIHLDKACLLKIKEFLIIKRFSPGRQWSPGKWIPKQLFLLSFN